MVKISPFTPNIQKLQVGDFIGKAGNYTNPGVIVEKKDDGTVVIDTDKDVIAQYHRHTNTSGLSVEEKDKFNGIMDEIMSAESNSEKISQLQISLDSLKGDPTNKKIVETLRNQQSELIRITKELPRIYQYEAERLR